MVVHLYRISDNVYTIYKFSNRGANAITEVAAGLAYNKYGNHSEDFLKDVEKFKVDITKSCLHQTANSRVEFLSRVFIETESWMNESIIKIPNRCIEICEFNFKRQEEEEDRERVKMERRFDRMKKAKGL